MLVATPKSVKHLVEGLEQRLDIGVAQINDKMIELIDVLGAVARDDRAMMPARRALMMVGGSSVDAGAALDDLHAVFLEADQVLGAEMGGFARLFESALGAGDVSVEDDFDIEGLPARVQGNLKPVTQAGLALTILQEIADTFQVRGQTAAGCIVLEAYCQLYAEDENDRDMVNAWTRSRGCAAELGELFRFAFAVEELTPQVIQDVGELHLSEPFALWFLAHSFAAGIQFDGLERRLVNTLLARAGLAQLSVFEMANLEKG